MTDQGSFAPHHQNTFLLFLLSLLASVIDGHRLNPRHPGGDMAILNLTYRTGNGCLLCLEQAHRKCQCPLSCLLSQYIVPVSSKAWSYSLSPRKSSLPRLG
jgi:hypothetical protein